jgi:hypothetical protein
MAGSVDGNDFDIVGLDGSSESQGVDAAETIDANFDHVYILQFNIVLLLGAETSAAGNFPCHSDSIITYNKVKNQAFSPWIMPRIVPKICRFPGIFSRNYCSFCQAVLE